MDLFSHTLCEEISKIKTDDSSVQQKLSTTENSTTSSPNDEDIEADLDKRDNAIIAPVSSSNSSVGNEDTSNDVSKTIQSNSAYIYSSEPLPLLPIIAPYVKEIIKHLISMIEIIGRVHEAGIVHRDIKPENFMLTSDKRLHIIDFGLSRFYMKGDKHVVNTHNRSIVGTIRYISTHIHDGDVYSRRDDIISIIYVAIYLVKGKLPWMGMTPKKGDSRTKEELVYDKKVKITSDELCHRIPYLFKKLLDYSYSLEFYDKPDYSYMIRQCKNFLKLYI